LKASGYRANLRELKALTRSQRIGIFDRDNFQCQIPACGRKVSLEVHHIKGEFADLRTEDYNSADNLITVCRDCHSGLTLCEINHLPLYRAFFLAPLLRIASAPKIKLEVPSQ